MQLDFGKFKIVEFFAFNIFYLLRDQELDRGEGIPYEGNYSGWLEKKAKRMEDEKRQDDRLKKTLSSELEWVRSNPKARQTKSKARLDRCTTALFPKHSSDYQTILCY